MTATWVPNGGGRGSRAPKPRDHSPGPNKTFKETKGSILPKCRQDHPIYILEENLLKTSSDSERNKIMHMQAENFERRQTSASVCARAGTNAPL